MKTILPLALVVLSTAACSGMSSMNSSGDSGGMSSYQQMNLNSTSYPVTDPGTGRLTYYHGG